MCFSSKISSLYLPGLVYRSLGGVASGIYDLTLVIYESEMLSRHAYVMVPIRENYLMSYFLTTLLLVSRTVKSSCSKSVNTTQNIPDKIQCTLSIDRHDTSLALSWSSDDSVDTRVGFNLF